MIDDREMRREMKRLDDELRDVPVDVRRRVLPRVGRGARTDVAKAVRTRYAVKAGAVRGATKVGRVQARGDVASVTLRVSGRPLGLESFGAARQTKRGVAVSIVRGARQLITAAFIARGRVYKRVGKTRLPVRPVVGPSVEQMAEREWPAIDKAVHARYARDLAAFLKKPKK